MLLAASLLYRQQGTPVVIVALSIASFTYGALLGPFFLGILWRRATQRDAVIGMGTGLAVMSVIVFAGRLAGAFPALAGALAPAAAIAWPWYVLIGTSVTVGVAIVASLTHPHPQYEPASK